jgi:hypothetical protein
LSGRNLASQNEKYISIVQALDVWGGEEQVPIGVVFQLGSSVEEEYHQAEEVEEIGGVEEVRSRTWM